VKYVSQARQQQPDMAIAQWQLRVSHAEAFQNLKCWRAGLTDVVMVILVVVVIGI